MLPASHTWRPGLMEHLLAALRAVAEPTRLRLVVLCSRGELTVSELTQILGQSQPRVSRHLKLLCEAGLLDRFLEGSWVFYRLSQSRPAWTSRARCCRSPGSTARGPASKTGRSGSATCINWRCRTRPSTRW